MYPVGCHHRTREVVRRFRPCSWSWVCVLVLLAGVGALQQVRADPGDRVRLGRAGEWRNTVAGVVADGRLYTIEDDGLYRVNPANGSWARVGKAEDWRGTLAGAIMYGKLYSVNANGALYESLLTSGQWKAVGKPVW